MAMLRRGGGSTLGRLAAMCANRQLETSFETLEARQLLSGDQFPLTVSLQKTRAGYDLLITGTKSADRIGITQDSRGIVIRDGSASKNRLITPAPRVVAAATHHNAASCWRKSRRIKMPEQ